MLLKWLLFLVQLPSISRMLEGHRDLCPVLIYLKSFPFVHCLFLLLWSQLGAWGCEIVMPSMIDDICDSSRSLTLFVAFLKSFLTFGICKSQVLFLEIQDSYQLSIKISNSIVSMNFSSAVQNVLTSEPGLGKGWAHNVRILEKPYKCDNNTSTRGIFFYAQPQMDWKSKKAYKVQLVCVSASSNCVHDMNSLYHLLGAQQQKPL